MKRTKWEPEPGDLVAVCYDGKWGRAVEGEVLLVGGGGNWINIKFIPWANEEAGSVRMWCCREFGPVDGRTSFRRYPIFYRKAPERIPLNRFGGWITGNGELGILRWLGCRGDFYFVFPVSELASEGYTCEPLVREPKPHPDGDTQ